MLFLTLSQQQLHKTILLQVIQHTALTVILILIRLSLIAILTDTNYYVNRAYLFSHWRNLLAISSFAKTKKSMLSWQLSDYFFTMVANFLLGGYTGAISISVSIIRNTLMINEMGFNLYNCSPRYHSSNIRHACQ